MPPDYLHFFIVLCRLRAMGAPQAPIPISVIAWLIFFSEKLKFLKFQKKFQLKFQVFSFFRKMRFFSNSRAFPQRAMGTLQAQIPIGGIAR